MLTRRQFLERAARAGAAPVLLLPRPDRPAEAPQGTWVNDVHSRLNRTRVRRIERPDSVEGCQALVRRAMGEDRPLCIAAGRHAMGGQQFGTDAVLLDTGALDEVIAFDSVRGRIEVGAGIQWPQLAGHLLRLQPQDSAAWSIRQKQSGAERLSLGGALAANAHGRGLALPPIVSDVESFVLVDASGEARRCSRDENRELFELAIGGYGLVGIITSVELRLVRRHRVRRIVEIIDLPELPGALQRRIAEGFLYGDFQYATDPASPEFLRRGVFTCYGPADGAEPVAPARNQLSPEEWLDLIVLAHRDRARAFAAYSTRFVSTSGQIEWSDALQPSPYVDDYHRLLGDRLGAQAEGTEMLGEVYVPRDALVRFMDDVRGDFLRHRVDLIYGTIRLIERDTETFLAWAREPWACVVFNLHTQHDAASLERTAADFRRLIDRALAYGGSYFLTYHRWASPRQIQACHPRFVEFLEAKRRHDPREVFQNDWYRHCRGAFL